MANKYVSNKVLELADQKWVELPETMKTGRFRHSCAVWNNKVWLLGGKNDTQNVKEVEDFNPADNSWEEGPELPRGLINTQTFIQENHLYLLGGKEDSDPNKEVFKLEDSNGKWETVPDANVDQEERQIFPALIVNHLNAFCVSNDKD